MGCSASTCAAAPTKGAHAGRCVLDSEGQHVSFEYAARTWPSNKDQDRFALLPGSKALACGIFDGHSINSVQNGRQQAELAAIALPTALLKRVAPILEPAEAEGGGVSGSAASLAAEACFDEHQQGLEAQYRAEVSDELLATKARLEHEIGETMPLELPQTGGTTATVALCNAESIFVSWVGDSRAIVIEERVGEDGACELCAAPLTHDHNAQCPVENARLLAAGATTGCKDTHFNGYVCVPEAEGMLAVSRSLGDCPFHRRGAVSSTPDIYHAALKPTMRCLVIASDGIWALLSNADAARAIEPELRREIAADASATAAIRVRDALIAAALEVANVSVPSELRHTPKRSPHVAADTAAATSPNQTALDDISVVVAIPRFQSST